MPKPNLKVPGSNEWAGYEADLDVRYAHKIFFGKSIAEVQCFFGGIHSIQRADELLFMPRHAFQYYVFAFADFVLSDQAAGDSDSASPFLRLLISREQRDPGSVSDIYPHLASTVEYVASHQAQYDADPNIYGSFQELATQLKALCGPGDAQTG
jgi:hypothetical protein